jgi:hypothetical protein
VPLKPLFAVAAAALLLSGCSLKSSNSNSVPGAPPPSGASSSSKNATQQLGFPVTATRNTTRVSGSDPVADAAGVASALFPANDATSKPPSVALVDKNDWQGAIAAGVLAGPPVQAPILLTDGSALPAVTAQTLARLGPGRAILVGNGPSPPSNIKSTVIHGGDPYSEAAAIDQFSSVAHGKPQPDVIVTTGEQAGYAMPAAAWAARSGDSVLFVKKNSVPKPTLDALRQDGKPHIWVLAPSSVISDGVLKQLGAVGTVKRISTASTPVDSAIAFARFKSGSFGWGATVPGQNLTVANLSRPADAGAAAGLGANGVFAPLLLTDTADPLPQSLEGYFLDIEPGFQGNNPSQGVYNHVWLLGASDAISAGSQARIDTAAALIPVNQAGR